MSKRDLDPDGVLQTTLEYAKAIVSNASLNMTIRRKALAMQVAIQDFDLSLLEDELNERYK